METSRILKEIMDQKGFKRKREVADYFGVSPQALSLWIAKDTIPPKHLLKISRENKMKENLFTPNQPKVLEGDQEQKTVIDYLMRENVALKEKIKILENQKIENNNIVPKNDLFNRIMADSLLLAGRISDGIITQIDGKWNELMGYDSELLIGKRYDREDLIHPDELKRVKKIEDVLKRSSSISQSKYSTIQRWKHGKTNHYVMLSMIWEIDVSNDSAVILAKPIDDVISD